MKCEVEMQRGGWSLSFGKQSIAWRCIASGSRAGPVLGQQTRTHGPGWRTTHASSIYRWEKSYSITVRQLPPRLVRVLLGYTPSNCWKCNTSQQTHHIGHLFCHLAVIPHYLEPRIDSQMSLALLDPIVVGARPRLLQAGFSHLLGLRNPPCEWTYPCNDRMVSKVPTRPRIVKPRL